MPAVTVPPYAARYLKPPRLPKVSPVVALHLRADGAHAFAMLTPSGRTVELVTEGPTDVEGAMRDRWPWFDHNAAASLGLSVAYAVPIDTTRAELRRWAGRDTDTDSPDVLKLRALAERCAGWMAVRSALVSIRRHAAEADYRTMLAAREGRVNGYAETDAAGSTIYHRHRDDHGSPADDHLRRAMLALTRAGMVERIDTPPTVGRFLKDGDDMQTARKRAHFFAHSVGHYKPTPTTPDLY